jgi:uncharacterized protein YtpQ (UPF0354 family)
MAKGAVSKTNIINKIMEVYPDAFLVDGKELRIPMREDGEEVQIKVSLTCAKTNVSAEGEAIIPKEVNYTDETIAQKMNTEPTEEEKKQVADILAAMGL